MIHVYNIRVFGWEAAIRGMRNPMNSWDNSDSIFHMDGRLKELGPNDRKLMESLVKGGPTHAKFRRMINVQMDINAPLYWWKEFDTYKVGTVANSCSTMHKIHAKEFALDDFSHEHLHSEEIDLVLTVIAYLNGWRRLYLESNKKEDWWQMIQLLPSSYNQLRTVQLNYEVLSHIYNDRKDHKLDEWRVFCSFINNHVGYKSIIQHPWIFTGEIPTIKEVPIDEDS